MPFDVENCVKYNANYLKGYTSERRDTNIDQLRNLVDIQSKDIVRFAANGTLQNYDRGVAWSLENLDVMGQQWQAAYLPVWLYSYQQVKGNKKLFNSIFLGYEGMYRALRRSRFECCGSASQTAGPRCLCAVHAELARHHRDPARRLRMGGGPLRG